MGQYIFLMSTQFFQNQHFSNVGFDYQVDIEIAYWPNIWSINFEIGSIIFQGTPQYQVNIDPITSWYCLDIGIIIESVYFSNIKLILQKPTFGQCWVWISSQYWNCILAQYLVNKFCYLAKPVRKKIFVNSWRSYVQK